MSIEYFFLTEINLKNLIGQKVAIAALVTKVETRKSKNDTLYLDITLKDKRINFNIKIFNAKPEQVAAFEINKVYGFIGTVKLWQNNPQIDVESYEPLDCDAEQFKEVPIDITPYITSIENSFKNMKHDGVYYQISRHIYDKYFEQIKSSPAAVRNHHRRQGELLYHTATMLKAGARLMDVYTDMNWDLLSSAIILHDLGKIYEYNLQEDGTVLYTTQGSLLGHIGIMLQEIAKAMIELNIQPSIETQILENAVAAHHGKLEYGSPVLPFTFEARLVNHLDMIDAEHYRSVELLESVSEGEIAAVKVGGAFESYIKVPATTVKIHPL